MKPKNIKLILKIYNLQLKKIKMIKKSGFKTCNTVMQLAKYLQFRNIFVTVLQK